MDLWQLRTLIVVAKTLNFTRASEELNLSQPAVSHQIKTLEREIGEQLFLRSKNGVSLTAAGRSACEHAKKILDIADDLKTDLRVRAETVEGRLVLGASLTGLNNPFYSLYTGFKELNSDAELVFQGESRPEDVVRKIREGAIDLGLVADEFLRPGVESIPYGEYRLEIVVGNKHRLATAAKARPQDLVNEKWVLFDTTSRFRRYTEEFFKATGITVRNIFETNDGSLVISMVSRKGYMSFLPSWGYFSEFEEGRIIPVEIEGWEQKVQMNLVWDPGRLPPVLRALITYLLNTEVKGVDLFRKDMI